MQHALLIICLFCSLHVMADESFGRLFFTPEQRAVLDQLRVAEPPSAVTRARPNQAPAQQMHAKGGIVKKVQGYVKRNDGEQSTVWIDGKPVQKRIDAHAVFK